MISKIEKNKFVFDPENGGGRRRRIKKVSRIDMMVAESNGAKMPQVQELRMSDDEESSARPFNV
jgi:hypothetical protein